MYNLDVISTSFCPRIPKNISLTREVEKSVISPQWKSVPGRNL